MVSVGSAPARRAPRARVVLAVAAVVLAASALWFRSGAGDVLGKQYEYEEDLTIDLDGSARLTVNASIAALVALRGLDLDPLTSSVDRDSLRAMYDSPVARVLSVRRPWRRRGRLFVQINLQVPDIRRLHESAPFSWSRYELTPRDGYHLFRQTVGASAFRPGTLKQVGWSGREVVAFRVHFPSRVLEHNARVLETNEATGVYRGNILSWEQHLADRLDGRELNVEVRLESRSILYRTLWLFAGAFFAAVLALFGLVWWILRRARRGARQTALRP